ncbi:uncharacterized protein [Argopecten irradians]|uniref:uncharacterized protein n=1 Tax=Argopecten irradians TaxID=31199 RepID=UPI00371AB221
MLAANNNKLSSVYTLLSEPVLALFIMAFVGDFDILHDLLMDPETDDESSIPQVEGNETSKSGNEIRSSSSSSTIASCAPPPPDPTPDTHGHVSSDLDDADDLIPSNIYTSGVSDLRNYIMSKRNENTVKKTEGCIKRFKDWIQAPPRSDPREVLQILPFELDTYIGGFLLSLQKNDGSNYEPDTPTSFHRGIDRYLRENGYSFNILTSDLFGNSTHMRSFNPKQFGNPENKSRCPIEAYKLYAKHRPQAMNTPESPFYVAVNQNNSGQKWFKNQPVGRNKLGVMMKAMASNAGLTGKKTNQSLRKTLCTKLLHSGVAPTTIMQLSGHKNVNSVNNYAVASFNQQREMCEILQNVKKSAASSSVASSVTSTVSHRPMTMTETPHRKSLPDVTTVL